MNKTGVWLNMFFLAYLMLAVYLTTSFIESLGYNRFWCGLGGSAALSPLFVLMALRGRVELLESMLRRTRKELRQVRWPNNPDMWEENELDWRA